ncbi:hypothetical protein [Desulfopila aestuarii]|uniref:Uncharacterized protein n=1 Tax=Desulfopila aestuarii DSM 18488 TaxID=1121416 RepID=A0A1M7YK54_9BACT|nr:hypothetical protein [Desulfopila aestuarii]SHO53000.1 hypothetical protein SAMN02745220_04880 [Desulfopila aestuarii DSM 18488]
MYMLSIELRGCPVYTLYHPAQWEQLRSTFHITASLHVQCCIDEHPQYAGALEVKDRVLSHCQAQRVSANDAGVIGYCPDPLVRLTLVAVKQAMARCIVDWNTALQDQWLKFHIDNPHDTYWEEREEMLEAIFNAGRGE